VTLETYPVDVPVDEVAARDLVVDRLGTASD